MFKPDSDWIFCACVLRVVDGARTETELILELWTTEREKLPLLGQKQIFSSDALTSVGRGSPSFASQSPAWLNFDLRNSQTLRLSGRGNMQGCLVVQEY